MKVKMTKDFKGSPDGIQINLYKKDEVYDLPEELGDVFLKLKACILFEEPIVEPIVEVKKVQVPQNKMEEQPENKKGKK